MTTEQEKALKVCEKLVDRMADHTLTTEDIMILIQGILSNDCGGCNWKYVQVPHYQPGLEPGKQPGWRPGEVWCESSTSNIAIPTYYKNEKEMIEEARKLLEKNGDPIISSEKRSGICAGDNIPDMQQVIH